MIKDTLTYDIVGSFLRPAEIKEARKAYKDGKITKEKLTSEEREKNFNDMITLALESIIKL